MEDMGLSKVLIVDDSEANIRIISAMLREKYEIHFATSGKDCLKLAEEGDPDLILLDILMPDLNGIEVCKALKQNPKTSGIPVVFVSALSAASSRYEGLDAGGFDYLIKPFTAKTALETVKKHIRRKV